MSKFRIYQACHHGCCQNKTIYEVKTRTVRAIALAEAYAIYAFYFMCLVACGDLCKYRVGATFVTYHVFLMCKQARVYVHHKP